MKKHKLIALLTLSALSLALLAGCGGTPAPTPTPVQNSEETPTPDRLARIKEAGEITVAMEGTWSPWTYHDESGTLTGFDVDVATAIAEKLGVKATFVEGGWDGLLAGLENGRYDIMVNGVNATPERAELYDFSSPYAYDRMAVIVRGDDDRIQAMEDLNGMSTANTITSIYAAKAQEYGANVTGVDDLAQTFQLLLSERIDATLNSELTFLDYMNQNPDSNLKVAVLADEADSIVIPTQKGEDAATLRAALDDAIEALRTDGTLTDLAMKYFGTDISGAK